MNDVDTPRRSTRSIVLMLVSLALLTALDLGSKQWALEQLSRERTAESVPICQPDAQGRIAHQRLALDARTYIPGFIEFAYEENCGAAFSMLRNAPGWLRALVFGIATIVAAIALTTMYVRGKGGLAFAAAVPITLSGALGNASDRVRHGFVVDFIRFDPELIHYPTFNVADIAIAVGVGLILLDGFFKRRAPGTGATK